MKYWLLIVLVIGSVVHAEVGSVDDEARWVDAMAQELARSYAGKEVDTEDVEDLRTYWLDWVLNEQIKNPGEEVWMQAEEILSSVESEKVLFSHGLSLFKLPRKNAWDVPGSDFESGPKTAEGQLFFDLPLSEDEKRSIRKLVTTISDRNVLQLLMVKGSLEKRGDKLRSVHPMRFIGFILADPQLRKCMKNISKVGFKWDNFTGDYEKRMKDESRSGNLSPYVVGFSEMLNEEQQTMQNYIDRGDYKGIIKHFL